jgi:hypothetical protein
VVATSPLSQTLLRQCLDPGQVVLEQKRERGGNGGEPVFVAFARSDGQLLHLIINVLDSEPDRFHDTQPAPVEELGDPLGGAVHEREHSGDFCAGHDRGDGDLLGGAHGIDTARQCLAEDALVEEHQDIHRLILGRRGAVAVHGQVRQERFNLRFGGEEVRARPQAGKPDEPLRIRALGMNGVVVETEPCTDSSARSFGC